MTDRPILFSAPMVRALLDGRKTQTRRLLPNPEYYGCPTGDCLHDRQEQCNQAMAENTAADLRFAVGDRLWAKETWRVSPDACEGWNPNDARPLGWIDYRARGSEERSAPDFDAVCRATFGKSGEIDWDCVPSLWRPSIFMPRWASRLTLAVTDVRVERLQDCSEADALAEGIDRLEFPEHGDWGWPQRRYAELWDSINGSGAWDANPWIVAVSFDVRKGNIDG